MVWWLAIALSLGALGIANAILRRLRETASVERERWEREYEELERKVIHYEEQIRQKIQAARDTVDFHILTQLHYESIQTANLAYGLLKDARVALDAIGVAIRDAGTEKTRLIAEKQRTRNPSRHADLEKEINALIELRNHLFPDKDTLKAQRDRFHGHVKRLNAQTSALKLAIRDRCGARGVDWYNRLEERTDRRRKGLPAATHDRRERGRVKWFDPDREYGFIEPDQGNEDVHVSAKNLRGTRSLRENDRVEFTRRVGQKGAWAAEVRKV